MQKPFAKGGYLQPVIIIQSKAHQIEAMPNELPSQWNDVDKTFLADSERRAVSRVCQC